MQADALGMSVEEEIARADGSELRVTFAPRLDGRDYPVAGSPIFDAVAFVRRDARTLEATGKKASTVVMRDTTVVDSDGRRMTISYEILAAGRVVATGQAVFQKRSD